LLAAEVSKQSSTSGLNDSKVNLLKALYDSKSNLPAISSYRDASDKGIADLIDSGIVLSKTDLDNLITSYSSEFDISVDSPSSSDTFETTRNTQHNILLRNCLKIMDGLV